MVFKSGSSACQRTGFARRAIVGWIYTLVVVGVTAWLALRPARSAREPLRLDRDPDPGDDAQPVPAAATRRFPALWLATL